MKEIILQEYLNELYDQRINSNSSADDEDKIKLEVCSNYYKDIENYCQKSNGRAKDCKKSNAYRKK